MDRYKIKYSAIGQAMKRIGGRDFEVFTKLKYIFFKNTYLQNISSKNLHGSTSIFYVITNRNLQLIHF